MDRIAVATTSLDAARADWLERFELRRGIRRDTGKVDGVHLRGKCSRTGTGHCVHGCC